MIADSTMPDPDGRQVACRSAVAVAGLLLAGLLLSAPAFANALPQRKAGLWAVTSQDNAFADWKMCVDDARYNLVESDVWSDFTDECAVQSHEREGESYKFTAKCESGATGAVDLSVTLTGDFSTHYRLSVRTESAGPGGHTVVQSSTLDANFVGACPKELAPGAKEMRGGMVAQPPKKTAPASNWTKH